MGECSILIVEDEVIVAADLTNRLRHLGYTIAGSAGSGEKAVALARQLRPSLVLMDIRLAGAMDGITAAEIIRSECDLPVVFLTAHSDPATLDKAKLTDAFGYIVKPFVERELKTTIEMAVYKHASGQRLRESEERFRRIAETSVDVIFQMDVEGRLTYCSPAIRLYGYDPEKIYGRSFSEFIPAEELAKAADALQRVNSGENISLFETRMLTADGSLVSLELSSTPILKNNAVTGIQGIARDITERKRIEEELRSLNEELEHRVRLRTRFFGVLAGINEAIVRRRDRQALFDEVCRIIVETGGFKLAWIGLLDPETREVRPAASYGATGYLDGIRIIAADVPEGRGPTGRAVSEGRHVINRDFEQTEEMAPWREKARMHGIRSSSALPLRDAARVVGALTIYSAEPGFFSGEETSLLLSLAEDISFALETISDREEKMKAEAELHSLAEELRKLTEYLQEMRETERTAIAREIHDELGQIITALRMHLSWLQTKYRDDDVLFLKSGEMLALVDSMIQTVQNIISELRPGILDVLGIYAAIEWQAAELTKMSGIPCKLELPSEEIPLGEKISINIFRIIQELFTNIVRYANATSVSLSLSRIDNQLLLTVSDNGIGISQEKVSSPSSFGIIGIRERVLSMGGDIRIGGTPGAGTSVTITIPFEDTGEAG